MKEKGFTLLEITIVIAIISILATIFLADYRGSDKRFALQRSAHQLAQSLRGAKEAAMAGERFYGFFPKGGYGIYLEKDSGTYLLFADCDGNGVYSEAHSEAGSAPNCKVSTSTNTFFGGEKVEEFSLEEGIIVSNISISGADFNVIFFPPEPVIFINPGGGETEWITLFFGSSEFKKIIINKIGLIDIE